MPGALPVVDVDGAARPQDPAAYRDVAKGAAYRQKAMPDLSPATRVRGRQPERVFRHRIAFSKTGDARFLSHRNTMDVFERAIRAAGLPARYSEGFNPHMRLSMGPALALGLESRHEVFDVDANAPFPEDAGARIAAKLPAGSGGPRRARARGRRGAAVEGREGRALLGAPRFARSTSVARARRSAASGGRACPRCGRWRSRRTATGASLTFEVNLDQAAGETATAKKVLEAVLAIPPEAQASMSVVREATVLAG